MPVDAPPAIEPVATTDTASKLRWFVVHTKPRCEKKFAMLMDAEHIKHDLFLLTSTRRYGKRVRTYEKPVFPSYVFIHLPEDKKGRCYQQDLIVRLIEVDDEPLFLRQIDAVRRLVASGNEIILYPLLKRGATARIKSGPLRGIRGIIDNPENPGGIVLSIDMIQQGVLVKIAVEDLEIEP